nr:immunoglobulin heavy chain junction region [Macaca mulatta]MOW46949.1 immunoglobulin heavy chain junction region [Macaca mulatta]MOW48408.1 immunoglobulin heavy chain junction region [Macaca mulatta]MOW48696.1 immunoglobulin heavy chain junction region [Macaca mulatta]MOW48865.1 immunoglobulin heavy chain junction region [Macaca mulatta]
CARVRNEDDCGFSYTYYALDSW